MLRKSSGPLRPWRRLRVRRAASLRVSGYSAFFSDCISSREACMNSTSSGSGLRSVLAIALGTASATSRRRISASTSALNFSMRSWYSSFSSVLVATSLAADRSGGLHQLSSMPSRSGCAACGQ